jgi:hypothetical protein
MKGTNALIVLTALAVAGGCVGCSSPTTTTSTPPKTAAGASPTAATSTPLTTGARRAVAATSPAIAWATTPITVTHEPPVPPLPVISGIRYASHKEGFDRIVVDIPGLLPGYSAKYVTEVRRDGSGELVSIPGEAFLLIVLHPAQAHRDDGTSTVTGIHSIGLPGIKAYAIVGDYEGYVSIALGVNGVRKYHVAELTNRIYIDVTV